MAAPVTPEEWLPLLTKRLDDRRPRIDLLRSYVNGDAPLPEAGQNIRASWTAFQKKARTNFADLAVSALAERMIPNGITVGTTAGDDDRARQIWRENRMDVAFADTLRDMLTVSIGYMVTGRDAFGRPVVTSEKPEFMYAATDPLRPWVARAGVKVWRDDDEQRDYAYVWAVNAGMRQKFEREYWEGSPKRLIAKASGTWRAVGEPEQFTGEPITVFDNYDSAGEFEYHTDILDRINKGMLDRLVTSAYQAFRQRAVEGGLPKNDPDTGEPIDYSAIFAPAPGAVWDLPEGIKIWESQEAAQSITAMLMAEKDDIRDFSAVTRTPMSMLVPDGQNQSAEGSEFAKEGLVMKARDRIGRVKPPLASVLTNAIRVLEPDFAETVDVSFADPTHASTAERYEAAVKAQDVGVPWRTIMIDILGFSSEKVDAMQTEREEEQLAAQLAAAAQPAPEPEPQDAAVAA
jgi:hypothetical protein